MQSVSVAMLPYVVHCFVFSVIDFAFTLFSRCPWHHAFPFAEGKKVPNEHGQFLQTVSLKTVEHENNLFGRLSQVPFRV